MPPEEPMVLSRRQAVRLLGAAAGFAAAVPACRSTPREGACPVLAGRRVRWIVPRTAGGGFDAESRVIQPFLERRLGTDILVENQPGAGGIIGARAIAAARPDGLTMGIVGVPGLIIAALTGHSEAPRPAQDLSILGRISRSRHVWATGARSGLRTIQDVFDTNERRPLVFATTEAGSTDLLSINVTAALIGVRVRLVAGFAGTRNVCLAALRGDVDLLARDFDTIGSLLRDGELRPLLQVSDEPIEPDPVLDGVPMLGGESGLAAARRLVAGLAPGEAVPLADALSRVVGSGRVVAAPAGLPPETAACLSRAIHETLTSRELEGVAPRALDVADAEGARRDIDLAARDAPLLLPFVRAALRQLRGA